MRGRAALRSGKGAAAIAVLGLALAACTPQDVTGKVTERAAESVVAALIRGQLTEAQTDSATRCIVRAASPAEQRALARDVGAYAGTLTRDNVRALIARPAAQSCLTAAAIPPLAL